MTFFHRRGCIGIVVLSLLATAVSAQEAQWALVKESAQVKLYTRSVEGSDYIAVKAVARINAPFLAVTQVMGDGEACSQWRKLCKSSQVFNKQADTERYIYMVLDMPWPLADRDMVIHSQATTNLDNKTLIVDLQPASQSYPMQDYIRAESAGSYQITALSDELMEFSWIMHTHLGGDVSPAMINKRLASTTYEDVMRLVSLAEQ